MRRQTRQIVLAWIFRALTALAGAALALSFSKIWWSAHIGVANIYQVSIYAWGIRKTTDTLGIDYIVTDATPFYQSALAWIFLGLCAAIVIVGSFLKGKKGAFLIGGAGLAFVLYALTAIFMVVSSRIEGFGIPLQGYIDRGDPNAPLEIQQYIPVTTSLRFGYYLALAAGLFCIALALFKRLIIGKHGMGAGGNQLPV
jgi:hypothetical protein